LVILFKIFNIKLITQNKMESIKNKIKSVFLAVGLLLLSSMITHAGFGISPADFDVDFLQPGSTFTKTYLISRSGDLGELDVIVEPDMGIVNDWLTFTPGNTFTIKKGARTIDFKVTIDVPLDAEYSEYPGSFTIRAVPAGADVKGVTIAQGLKLNSDIKVTEDEIVNLSILNIVIDDVEFGDPVVVKLTGDNKGNVNTTPTFKVTLMDLEENILEEHEVANLPVVESGVTKEITGQFNTELGVGEYYAKVEVFLEGDLLREEKVVLRIREEKVTEAVGSTKDSEKGSFASFVGQIKDYIWIIGLAIVVAVLALILLGVFWKSREREGKATTDPLSVAGGSQMTTRVTLSIAFGLLTTFALITNISSGLELTEIPLIDRKQEVQGTSDTISQRPAQPMLTVVEEVVRANSVPYPVYEKADESSNIIYEAKEDEQLEVTDELGNWYQVKIPTGELGWVSKTIVKSATTKNQ